MKKLNKWIAGLLCMMLVITMVAGLGVTEVKADDAVTTVSSWNELKNAISKGGNIQLDKNITAGTGDYRFNVDKNVTIDLNGYTIDRNLNEQQDNVFSVIAGGTLIIKDTSEGQNGKITGGWANEDYAGGINVREGTLILESGNIVGNRSNKTFTKRGGGVAVFYNGTFIMRGGKISGNEAGYGAGVVVLDNCNFEMTGGEITDNICDFGEYQDQEGAGVFAYQGADVTIGGSANIYGNKNSNDENSNLYIYRYKSSEKINLSTTVPLTSGAKIGVGYYQPYGKNEIPLADSGKQFKDAFFTDDDKNYEITTKDGVDGIFYSPKNSSGGSSTPSTPTSYNLRVGGVEVTSANTSGTGWSYDNQTNTLTLDGFNYEGDGSGIEIETLQDLNIIIKNENRIKKDWGMDQQRSRMQGRSTFSGAIRGLQRMYEKKVYPMSMGEAVWICSDGVHIFMTKADQSIEHELLAEVFYVAEYEEYWLTPEKKRMVFLESGQPLGEKREYYIPRGTIIQVSYSNNMEPMRFELA